MKDEKQRMRKAYSREGLSQKMMTFRIDFENVELLKQVANKGKLVNDLLKEYFSSRNVDESRSDNDPAGNTSDDYRP